MGRFSSVLLLTLAACGDNFVDQPGDTPPVDDRPTLDTSLAGPRYVPAVCSTQTWSTSIAGTAAPRPGMNVSVVARADRAVSLATPKGGGELTGFVLDPVTHKMTESKVAIDGSFTQVVGSIVGDRLVSTAVDSGSVYMHLLDEDFSNPQYTAKLPGTIVAEPAFFSVQRDMVMPVAGDDGLWFYRFQDSFEPIDSTHIVTTSPVRSLTAAQMGVAMLTAFSTDEDCYMNLTSTFSGGTDAHLPYACNDPRLAVNASTGEGIMVFNTSEGVHMMPIDGMKFGGATTLMRPETDSPRAAFDGQHYWVSYLDARGDVVVGFLDDKNNLVTMGLSGTKPETGAYELVKVGSAMWVFALTDSGYEGYQMCLDQRD